MKMSSLYLKTKVKKKNSESAVQSNTSKFSGHFLSRSPLESHSPLPISISSWTEQDVSIWLEANGMKSYVRSFRLQAIDGEALLLMNGRDLKILGVNEKDSAIIEELILEKAIWRKTVADDDNVKKTLRKERTPRKEKTPRKHDKAPRKEKMTMEGKPPVEKCEKKDKGGMLSLKSSSSNISGRECVFGFVE